MKWSAREYAETPSSMPRRRRRLAVGFVITVALVMCTMWWVATNRLRGRFAELRARGEPVTYAELDAMYPEPAPDEDATQLWLSAGAAWQTAAAAADVRKLAIFGEAPEPPPPGKPWAEYDYARQFLADSDAAVQSAHQAAAMGGRAKYLRQFDQNIITMTLSHVQTLRSAARGLALEAKVAAHAGDAHAAANAIQAGFRLSDSLENEPLLISQLVRLAVFGVALSELKIDLGRVEFSDDDLARLSERLQAIDLSTSEKRSLLGERVYGLEIFQNPASAGITRWQALLARPVRGIDMAFYLDCMSDYIAACDLPWPEQLAATDAASARLNGRLTTRLPIYFISSQIVPALNAYTNAFARCESVRRLSIIAISLERYRRREGHPAAELAALVPELLAEVPTDPTSGAAFQYAATDTSYVIYSPTTRFPAPWNNCGEQLDRETGANPLLVFRWPPREEEPCDPKSEDADDADSDGASDAPQEAPVSEEPATAVSTP